LRYQNAGEKGILHPDPEDPPHRRANQARGHGRWETDRPPVLGTVGRETFTGDYLESAVSLADGDRLVHFSPSERDADGRVVRYVSAQMGQPRLRRAGCRNNGRASVAAFRRCPQGTNPHWGHPPPEAVAAAFGRARPARLRFSPTTLRSMTPVPQGSHRRCRALPASRARAGLAAPYPAGRSDSRACWCSGSPSRRAP
jgi:transposase